MNGILKVFKAHLCDLVETTFGNGVFELSLKNLIEKHLVYSIDFLFNDETLNDSIVQNTKSCVKIENHLLKHDLAKEQASTSKDLNGSYWWTRSASLKFHCLEVLIKQLRKCFEDSLKWKRERFWCFHLQFEELFWKFRVANEVQNGVKPFNTNSLTSKRDFLANDVCDLESLLVKASWILQYNSRTFQNHFSRIYEGSLKSVDNLSLYYHHPFGEIMFQTFDLLDLLFQLEKDKSFYYHLSFKDVDFNIFFDLQKFNPFNCASISRILVNFFWLFNSAFWSFLVLKFFVYTSFSYHRPFKDLYYLWNSMVLRRMDLRMNSFKGGADGMPQDVEGTIELLQGLVTRAMARRMEKEHRGKIAIFKKIIQDLAWKVIGA
ncbi:hypothetical protein M9H77_17597 [Catharanthus roseus]|uniref:Uncharacterized protein n=1 Tax=Catharanthus roseus TaxID=4058 RepID=A0ACC0B521_CATRO|nr:hypothetical protein M9H77_17597 [Catharanthus roseus]